MVEWQRNPPPAAFPEEHHQPGREDDGVTVRVSSAGTTNEVVTAEDGGYLFELPGGDYRLELSRAGYTTCYRDLTVRPEQTVRRGRDDGAVAPG